MKLENKLSIIEPPAPPEGESTTTFNRRSTRMCKTWLVIIVIAVAVLVSLIYAGLEIYTSSSKVAVYKQDAIRDDLKKSIPDFKDKLEERNASTKLVNNEEIQENINSTEHSEVVKWPKVFVLSYDPSYPVVCYSGVSLAAVNETDNKTLLIPSQESGTSNNDRPTKIFVLSADPLFPVICREGHVPANLTDGTTAEGDDYGDAFVNVTCIRRDYENDISALFLHQTGPLQTAFNIFNSSISYGFFNVENVENIGYIKILNETVVDCGDYNFIIGDKAIGGGAAASLVG